MIDETLGEYINNYHDKSKLKVMFIRLNPGVYQFGSKKICVGVEQGRINIRVGGGYMVIEEFLDQYTTIELEKSIRDGMDYSTYLLDTEEELQEYIKTKIEWAERVRDNGETNEDWFEKKMDSIREQESFIKKVCLFTCERLFIML